MIGNLDKRREDRRFLTGQGRYVDDLYFDNQCHAVFLRSSHAHAKIENIYTELAESRSDVLAVLTSVDIEQGGLRSLKPFITSNPNDGSPFNYIPQPLLAKDVVRFVGEPIVLIVAETINGALDALDLIEIEYSILPFVISAHDAMQDHSPRVVNTLDNNICLEWKKGNSDNINLTFEKAEYVVDLSLNNHRIITNPMEPRGVVASWNTDNTHCTIFASSQNIHVIRDTVAEMLNIQPKCVRFVAPDVGGGFGSKNFSYPEYALIAWASKQLSRTVKWISTRSEVFLGDHQGRDHSSQSRLALDVDGRFLALEIKSLANLGAYLVGSSGGVQVVQYANLPGTVYRVPKISLEIAAAFTNTTPTGVFRGPGYAETNFIIERLIDIAAQKYNLDRFDLRRKNLVPRASMPFTDVLNGTIDSGNFPDVFEKLLKNADFSGFKSRSENSKCEEILRGFGVACFIKGTGGAPEENVEVCFLQNNTISLITGTQTIGQGHETTFPQILASQLGIESDIINLEQGDTDLIIKGGGHGSSRATYMGGTAIYKAVQEIIRKGIRLSAGVLEVEEKDILFENGRFSVMGTNYSIELFELAAIARENNVPLDTYYSWEREAMTFPNGAHAAEVEIDVKTGRVKLYRYTAVDDYGVLINPLLVSGQLHGAIAHGVGQAMLEVAVVNKSTGQPVTGSFMDYAVPKADDLPDLAIEFSETRCTTNPLGVKGSGEGGTVAAVPAVVNSIINALTPFGVSHLNGPMTSSKIWNVIHKV